MKKKVYFNSALYDLSCTTETVIEQDIRDRMKRVADVDIDPNVTIGQDFIEISVKRNFPSSCIKSGHIHEADNALLMGPDAQFDLMYDCPIPNYGPSHPINIFWQEEDVKKYYKMNAKAAGASRYKDIELYESSMAFSLLLRFK